MKKAIAILLSVILCISVFAGCQAQPSTTPTTSGGAPTNPPATTEAPQTTPPAPQKTALTKSNVSDYLIFNVKVEDVEVKHSVSTYYKGSATGTVKVSAKKNVEFEDVEITLKLTTSSNGWKEKVAEERTMQIAYNGTAEASFKLGCVAELVSSNPEYKVEIITVSGNVITK